MAFSATAGGSGDFHYLATVDLAANGIFPATTLRFAEEDISILESNTEGAFYAGKLPKSGTIVRDLGTFLEAKETVSTYDLQVDNSDGVMERMIQNYIFANREVIVYLGEGQSKSNYSEVFRGNIAHPNGVSWDEDEAIFVVIDKKVKDRRFLPPNTFNATSYPYVVKEYKNAKIPIVYGNWSSAAPSGLSIPAVCIDRTIPRFQVCNHRLRGIDRWLNNAQRIPRGNIGNLDLNTSKFDLVGGYAYNATNDVISVNCCGMPSGAVRNIMIEKPAQIVRSMLTSWMNISSTSLDVTAFNTCNDSTGTDVCRRYINEETSSETLLSELLGESGIDMRFVKGKYSPVFRQLGLVAGQTDFWESDIVMRDQITERAEFRVERDPDRFFANKIRGQYRYNPIDVRYDAKYTVSSQSSIVNVGSIVERLMDFNWYYDDVTTQTRLQRELSVFTKETLNIQFTATRRAMMLDLADQLRLNYNVFTNRAVQIRKLETNLWDMTTRISGFNLFMLGMGRWCADGASGVGWSLADATNKQEQGFWCNVDGYASSAGDGDPASLNASRWF